VFVRAASQLARLEGRHWVALIGSAALHLGVWLGMSQAPVPTETPPMTFEVKLEPPPAAKPVRQHLTKAKPKAHKVKARKLAAKHHKPVKSEPKTLQAEWKGETRPLKDAPAIKLPDARAIGVDLSKPTSAPVTSVLAKATGTRAASPAMHGADGGGLSEPGGATGASPGVAATPTLAAVQSAGKARAGGVNAGAQGSDALAASAAASGNQANATLSASAASGGSLDRAASGGGLHVSASDSSSQSPGALASGEPSGVRLTLAGVLSSLAIAPQGGGSLAGGQLNGASGASAASAGSGSQAELASAASTGQPATKAAVGPTRADAGGNASGPGERGAAASGGAVPATLERARYAANSLTDQPGSGISPTPAGNSSNPEFGSDASGSAAARGTARNADKLASASAGASQAPASRGRSGGHGALGADPESPAAASAGARVAGAGTALSGAARERPGQAPTRVGTAPSGTEPGTGTVRARGLSGESAGEAEGLASASDTSGTLPGRFLGGAGLASGRVAPVALNPGEPGGSPRLALSMPTVPAILDLRPGGAGSASRGGSGQGASAGSATSGSTPLVTSGGGQGTPLAGRAGHAPIAAAPTRLASLGGGGASGAVGGTLIDVREPEVRRIRQDSQVETLDVLAPSTYCPLPGHVQPDNRPKVTETDVLEKPEYASDSPSFSFPLRAWAYGHQGRVTVRVQVQPDGTPGKMWIKQSSGSGILDVDAREQLAKYHFKPARKNGQAVAAWIDVPVDYRLHAESKP
jgi:TonB family protein